MNPPDRRHADRRDPNCPDQPCSVLQIVMENMERMDDKLDRLLEAQRVDAKAAGVDTEKLKNLAEWRTEHIGDHKSMRLLVYGAVVTSIASLITRLWK